MKVNKSGHIVTVGICRLDVLDYTPVTARGTVQGHQFRMNERQLRRLADFLKEKADEISGS
ncbi:MAG: hypothetical protein DRQ78_09050 [Epsilonproteobacteria bacterium]|nr:MAG: hypothetical protein DRQ78_09050 [Campylobacterota bacterium]